MYNFSKKISMNFRKIHDVFLKLPVILSELLPKAIYLKVGSINSIFYFLHKAAEPFNCLEQDNLA